MTPAERTRRMLARLAARNGITLAQLIGEGRDKKVVMVRHQAMHSLWRKGLTLEHIGHIFNRDHTTVHYACRKIEKEKINDGRI